MLPRWPTGGNISLGLSRIYAEQLSQEPSASRALRQAMVKARDLPFDIEKEPQLKPSRELGDVSAKHPFFWSSFLVLDQPRSKVAAKAVNPVPAVPGAATPGPTSATPAAPQPAPPAPAGSSTQGSPAPSSGSGTQTPSAPAPDPGANVEKPAPEATKTPVETPAVEVSAAN